MNISAKKITLFKKHIWGDSSFWPSCILYCSSGQLRALALWKFRPWHCPCVIRTCGNWRAFHRVTILAVMVLLLQRCWGMSQQVSCISWYCVKCIKLQRGLMRLSKSPVFSIPFIQKGSWLLVSRDWNMRIFNWDLWYAQPLLNVSYQEQH